MAFRPAISSMSLGRAWVHELPEKFDQAAAHGIQGIEIFYEDLEYLALEQPGGLTDDSRLEAARQIRRMCDVRHLTIIALQPFQFYEGLIDRTEHERQIAKLHLWFRLVRILGTDIIQIPSNFQREGTTGDRAVIVADLRKVADLGARQRPPVRFAYENLCWGTHINVWEEIWEVVAAVDRTNFGMCLDTFNICGRAWADPAAPDGKIPNADALLRASLQRMRKTIDVSKVFYIEVVDAERMREPVRPGHAFHIDGHPARMGWSRNARLFAFEERGYLPVIDVLKAITGKDGLGYQGWVAMELFSRSMNSPDPSVPKEHARRAMKSWKKLEEVMGWDKEVVRYVEYCHHFVDLDHFQPSSFYLTFKLTSPRKTILPSTQAETRGSLADLPVGSNRTLPISVPRLLKSLRQRDVPDSFNFRSPGVWDRRQAII